MVSKRTTKSTIKYTPPSPETLSKYATQVTSEAHQEIKDYVESQSRDEKVTFVEKIKEEIVLSEKYEVWDVATDKSGWWVISSPTNLYNKKHFPSIDYTISFHIGLMLRVQSRNAESDVASFDPFEELGRRRDQASRLLESAVEYEDFQSIGLRLRECLLVLVKTLQRWKPEHIVELPKAGDFSGWVEIQIGQICGGGDNKQLRHYLKATAKETWQLVNWLTHDKDANHTSSRIALHAVDTLIGHMISLFMEDKFSGVSDCPNCKSNGTRSFYDKDLPPNGDYFISCSECGWDSRKTT